MKTIDVNLYIKPQGYPTLEEMIEWRQSPRTKSEYHLTPKHLRNCKIEKAKVGKIRKLCRLISKATGIKHHVDHMWPIAAGGPHWSGNMQIIPAEDNLRKYSKVDPAVKATIQEMLDEEVRLNAER